MAQTRAWWECSRRFGVYMFGLVFLVQLLYISATKIARFPNLMCPILVNLWVRAYVRDPFQGDDEIMGEDQI